MTGAFAALFAGLFPLDVLGELISIGILLAFAVVCIGVLVTGTAGCAARLIASRPRRAAASPTVSTETRDKRLCL